MKADRTSGFVRPFPHETHAMPGREDEKGPDVGADQFGCLATPQPG
jgi:hypothetical protein